jgi:hypothetical protein
MKCRGAFRLPEAMALPGFQTAFSFFFAFVLALHLFTDNAQID